MRCLSDLAFMLGQYEFAVAHYRLAAQDYLAAPNSKWYAGAEVRERRARETEAATCRTRTQYVSMVASLRVVSHCQAWYQSRGPAPPVHRGRQHSLSNADVHVPTQATLAIEHAQPFTTPAHTDVCCKLCCADIICCMHVPAGDDRHLLHPDARSVCGPHQILQPRL